MPSHEPRPPRRITPLATPTFAPISAGFPLAQPDLVALVRAAHGVVAGVPLALAAFYLLDAKVEIRVDAEDGAAVDRGDCVLFLSGPARGLLSAERVALNFLQRLSGIATLTARFVAAVQGTPATIVDTRKTTPGWRALEKYAVRCGGGRNHRRSLAEAVLIKDNHIAACEGDITVAVQRARAHAPKGMLIQVECDTESQVRAAVDAGADALLLDNMSTELMRQCVALARGKAWTEASGGVTLESVRAVAETGVDRISIGALTHSAPCLDLAVDVE